MQTIGGAPQVNNNYLKAKHDHMRQFIHRLRQAGGDAATAADMLDAILERGDMLWLGATDNPPFDFVDGWIYAEGSRPICIQISVFYRRDNALYNYYGKTLLDALKQEQRRYEACKEIAK